MMTINFKGILFLFFSAVVLTLTINMVRNNNHFFLSYKTNITYGDKVTINNRFEVLKETEIYIQSFKEAEDMDIMIKISDQYGDYYNNQSGVQEELYKLKLEPGLYTLTVDGSNGLERKFNMGICYFTDQVIFLKDEIEE